MEPAAEPVAASGSAGGDEGLGLVELKSLKTDASRAVVKAYNRANAIDAKDQGYKWGGGHGSFNDSGGYDCSGFVSSCLHAAGLLNEPQATGGLDGWGESGRGKYMTVWVKETGVPTQSHTFMTFTIRGRTTVRRGGRRQ